MSQRDIATDDVKDEIKRQWGLIWPCPDCGCEEEGMHFTGGYTWDEDKYMQGPPCPFGGGPADLGQAPTDIATLVALLEQQQKTLERYETWLKRIADDLHWMDEDHGDRDARRLAIEIENELALNRRAQPQDLSERQS